MLRIGRLIILLGVIVFFAGLVVSHGEVTEMATRIFTASLSLLFIGIVLQLHDLES